MPRAEKESYIIEYGKRNHIDKDSLLVVKEEFLNIPNYGMLNKLLLFDSNGYYIDVFINSADPKCKGNSLSAISGFGKETFFPRDSNLTFIKESMKWQYLSTKIDYDLNKKNQTDYTVIYYWNTFLGKYLNCEHVEEIKDRIRKNSSVTFDFILINEDFREGMEVKY
jgi:hypothetical protein